MSKRISVIIPTYRDCDALEMLLQRLADMQPAIDEVIVVDAGENDLCSRLCREHGVTCLVTSPCRGAQLDRGARYAAGEILWFLHADSQPAADAPQQILSSISNQAVGGFFKFQFSGPRSWRLRLFESITNWRSRYGIPYGDQGLFVRRDCYTAAGGFPHQPLFEEVSLIKALRAEGDFNALDQTLPTSPRRWEHDGWWRRTVLNRGLAIGYRLGVPIKRLSKWYENWRV